MTFLTGPSGAGKSTLLKLAYLALRPTAGRVSMFGVDTSRLSRKELAPLRRRIGVIFQEFRLLDHLMQHPGRVFSREQLLDAVWGSDVYVEARTVDVHVGRLRKALNVEGTVNPIRTVRSAGYSLDLGG